MIDSNALVRTWLLTPQLAIEGELVTNQVPVVLADLFTAGVPPNDTPNRVYAGKLIAGFNPQNGPGLVVLVGGGTTAGSGGGSARPEVPLREPRMQVRAWANKDQFDVARKVYGAAYDWMQRRNNINLGDAGYIWSCLEQVEGQDIADPHSGLATVMGYWKLLIDD